MKNGRAVLLSLHRDSEVSVLHLDERVRFTGSVSGETPLLQITHSQGIASA